MADQNKKGQASTLTRREVLKSVGKYSAAATGAAVVAISATEALAQASSSNGWNCQDYYPWWLCWWLGYKQGPSQNYGGWNDYPDRQTLPDSHDKGFGSW